MSQVQETNIIKEEAVKILKYKDSIVEAHKINIRKANWIGHNLCKNCLPKHVTEGNVEGRIEVTGRQGRRCKAMRRCCKLRPAALYRTLWRKGVGRGYGPAWRQTKKWVRIGLLRVWNVKEKRYQ